MRNENIKNSRYRLYFEYVTPHKCVPIADRIKWCVVEYTA